MQPVELLKIVDAEIERLQRYQAGLTVSLMKFNFNGVTPAPDHLGTERILRGLGEAFSRQIRKCDTLSRFDHRTFVLFMPHSSKAEVRLLCNRLELLFEEICNEVDCLQLKLTIGLADYVSGSNESGADFITRASTSLQNAV